jgi:hypothetical protein
LVNVSQGTHRVQVEKDGFVPQNIEIEVFYEGRGVLRVSFVEGNEPFAVSYVPH